MCPRKKPSPTSPSAAEPPVTEARLLSALDEVFGFRQFRPNQREIIAAVLEGRDVFAVMPTGGGKSLCYQLPAHVTEGTCLVVSPLISLMKDQVDAAVANGLQAEFLNSSLDGADQTRVTRRLMAGELDLLYLAPERLAMERFLPLLKAVRLSLIAVDEAHCISEWGHDFRKDYLTLDRLVPEFPHVPVAAFTATATHRVEQDIIAKLGLRNPFMVRASFDRPNLFYQVIPKDDVERQVLNFVRARPTDSGIIYRTTRKGVESTAAFLQGHKIKALPYHAGLDQEVRKLHQEMFNRDEVNVIVATIAFGMGIDKSNIRYVIHGDLPKNIEGYYQETGRSGRDGEMAECALFFSYGDVAKLRYFIKQVQDPQQRADQELKLKQMADFGSSSQCRRRQILRYFGEKYPSAKCGACDVCAPSARRIDSTREAQIVLSAVARTQEQSPAAHVIDIVTGQASEQVLALEHDQLKTFGVGKDRDAKDWAQTIADLLERQCLLQASGSTESSPPSSNDAPLTLTDKGRDVLFGRRGFTFIRTPARTPPIADDSTAPVAGRKLTAERPEEPKTPPPDDTAEVLRVAVEDEDLFDVLRSLRKKLAQGRGVPPFVVFSDRTLRELARVKPVTLTRMREVTGVGAVKLREYGSDFIISIGQYLDDHGRRRRKQPT